MRGKVIKEALNYGFIGITPAYAGKRLLPLYRDSPWWDHPRLCGEKHAAGAFRAAAPGSPPPMRGKGFSNLKLFHFLWITPAYAGKSKAVIDFLGFLGDHPRLCGEKILICPVVLSEKGSPPPMRGKDQQQSEKYCYRGITPAYAGKS